MASLEQIFEDLKKQVQSGECKKASNNICYADRVLRIPGLTNLTIKVSYGSDGHYFMSLYRGGRITKQITVYADDANDFEIISAFLKKYGDVISKYVKRGSGRRNSANEVEVDLDVNESENQNESADEKKGENTDAKSTKTTKSKKPKKINIEEEF
ncbi:hypothetical protein D878_gp07 [Sulfolobales Mexican rudivirus 1]|uniref:PHA01746-like domain-containing protein n=1 Tax=Sulfolobales Mexican rod-shaped virus 1 TaxID=2848122 RepID=K4NWU5_9VIRU|nr:hypothetical protein D878_gp07 [Sulfolobales Mexican rudivirus 1]AFV51234.1 hypothetical protein [Sulfolobales Mexican rod-shaped virus 1]